MKIAIHHRPGSFSDRWIEYCNDNGIEYKIVNAYDSNIIEQVKGCDAFMWHHHHSILADTLFAKQLIYSLETAGIKCFPDFHSVWHFDDKVGQKYLLESIDAPLVPSYVFYSKQEVLDWIDRTDFPKVFKLRGGAGSKNVMLVHDRNEAKKLVKRAFGKGFPQTSVNSIISEDIRKCKEGRMSFFRMIKDIALYYLNPDGFHKTHAYERGYVYFQDFIPNNITDFRVKVVDGNCWAFQRCVRQGDFRASGSGELLFDNTKIPLELVKIAQKTAFLIGTQSAAFDFIFDKEMGRFVIVELSYGFGFDANEVNNGYWDKDGVFHPELFNPFGWMVNAILR